MKIETKHKNLQKLHKLHKNCTKICENSAFSCKICKSCKSCTQTMLKTQDFLFAPNALSSTCMLTSPLLSSSLYHLPCSPPFFLKHQRHHAPFSTNTLQTCSPSMVSTPLCTTALWPYPYTHTIKCQKTSAKCINYTREVYDLSICESPCYPQHLRHYLYHAHHRTHHQHQLTQRLYTTHSGTVPQHPSASLTTQ